MFIEMGVKYKRNYCEKAFFCCIRHVYIKAFISCVYNINVYGNPSVYRSLLFRILLNAVQTGCIYYIYIHFSFFLFHFLNFFLQMYSIISLLLKFRRFPSFIADHCRRKRWEQKSRKPTKVVECLERKKKESDF